MLHHVNKLPLLPVVPILSSGPGSTAEVSHLVLPLLLDKLDLNSPPPLDFLISLVYVINKYRLI